LVRAFGADAVQQAAIEEQMQNARENPLAAAAAAAAVQGKAPEPQNNMENLLDIDFDGAAPASASEKPSDGLSGLEGLAGTPQRVASPSVAQPQPPTIWMICLESLATEAHLPCLPVLPHLEGCLTVIS